MEIDTPESRPPQQAAVQGRAVLRVGFPDNCTPEAEFHPTTTVHNLVDLLMKVIAKPDWTDPDQSSQKENVVFQQALVVAGSEFMEAALRVRFPGGYILEAEFHQAMNVHILVDLLMKIITRPDVSFNHYTVPANTSEDYYTIGLVPGANIFFSYDLPAGPYLYEEIRTLDGMSVVLESSEQTDDSKTDSDSAHQDIFTEEADPSYLPQEILCSIARQAVPSRHTIEAMRAVCRHWLYAIPATRGPWLVLSPVNTAQPTVFLGIVQGTFVRQNPLFTPPLASYCWSCCRGWMALRVPETRGFCLCVNCGREYPVAHLPHNLHLTNFILGPQLVCAISTEDHLIRWAGHEDLEWHEFDYGLGVVPKSVDWVDGIACIAAAPSSLIVDWIFEERLLPISDELEEIYYDIGIPHHHPAPGVMDFALDVDPALTVWGERGHHTFHAEGQTYVCVVLRHSEDRHIEVRLFVMEFAGEEPSVQPTDSIGQYAVFLGANQAFAAFADPPLKPNSAYIVDDDGVCQEARVVVIDLLTGQETTLPYPPDIGPIDSFMTGSWLFPVPYECC